MKKIPEDISKLIILSLLPFSVWQASSLADKFTFTHTWTFLGCFVLLILIFFAINRFGFYLISLALEHLIQDMNKNKQGNNKALS